MDATEPVNRIQWARFRVLAASVLKSSESDDLTTIVTYNLYATNLLIQNRPVHCLPCTLCPVHCPEPCAGHCILNIVPWTLRRTSISDRFVCRRSSCWRLKALESWNWIIMMPFVTHLLPIWYDHFDILRYRISLRIPFWIRSDMNGAPRGLIATIKFQALSLWFTAFDWMRSVSTISRMI